MSFYDPVTNPEHYSEARFGCQCIEFTRFMTYPGGSAFAHIWRYADKDGPLDLEKARVYLHWAAEDWTLSRIGPILPGHETQTWNLERLYLHGTAGVYAALNHILHARWEVADDALAAALYSGSGL